MRATLWIVPGITLASLLAVGVAVFFFLLLGLNGVSEAKGGQALVAYLVLLLATLVAGAWGSHWSVRTLATQMNWSLWLAALISVVASVIIATVIIVVASMVVLFFAAI